MSRGEQEKEREQTTKIKTITVVIYEKLMMTIKWKGRQNIKKKSDIKSRKCYKNFKNFILAHHFLKMTF